MADNYIERARNAHERPPSHGQLDRRIQRLFQPIRSQEPNSELRPSDAVAETARHTNYIYFHNDNSNHIGFAADPGATHPHPQRLGHDAGAHFPQPEGRMIQDGRPPAQPADASNNAVAPHGAAALDAALAAALAPAAPPVPAPAIDRAQPHQERAAQDAQDIARCGGAPVQPNSHDGANEHTLARRRNRSTVSTFILIFIIVGLTLSYIIQLLVDPILLSESLPTALTEHRFYTGMNFPPFITARLEDGQYRTNACINELAAGNPTVMDGLTRDTIHGYLEPTMTQYTHLLDGGHDGPSLFTLSLDLTSTFRPARIGQATHHRSTSFDAAASLLRSRHQQDAQCVRRLATPSQRSMSIAAIARFAITGDHCGDWTWHHPPEVLLAIEALPRVHIILSAARTAIKEVEALSNSVKLARLEAGAWKTRNPPTLLAGWAIYDPSKKAHSFAAMMALTHDMLTAQPQSFRELQSLSNGVGWWRDAFVGDYKEGQSIDALLVAALPMMRRWARDLELVKDALEHLAAMGDGIALRRETPQSVHQRLELVEVLEQALDPQ